MDSAPPCTVCGCTDLNLVDGYYYCMECGTQDATIRETVIEYATKEDGTQAFFTQKKKIFMEKDLSDMGPEWYKWHAYNFIMAGLADELTSLGAGEGFKLRLLWLWSRYIDRYSDKKHSATNDSSQEKKENDSDSEMEDEKLRQKKCKYLSGSYKINRLTMPVMQGMLYAALNIARSEIQVGDLRRFIKEERVSCRNCMRFVPEDLNFKKMDTVDRRFDTFGTICDTENLRGYAMMLFKELKLGKPQAPDLHNLVSRYVLELCLPDEFKNLVFDLMDFIPICLDVDFLYGVPRTPNYEGVAMAYIIVMFKICFGLDDSYENMLSDAVEEYNDSNECEKVCKQNGFLSSTDRLFSFREWTVHMEYLNHIISKHHFPAAVDSQTEIDPQVFMSYTNDRVRKNTGAVNVGDDLMMDILGRLDADVKSFIKPKFIFPPSLTPTTSYVNTLLSKLDDPVTIELLGEDFTQYSLRYLTDDIGLFETPLFGVSVDKFFITHKAIHSYENKSEIDKTMVYVRDCDNEDWLTTKPPTKKHIRDDEEDYDLNEEKSRLSDTIDFEDNVDDMKSEADLNQNEELVFREDSTNVFNDDFKVTKKELWGTKVKEEIDDSKEFQSEIVNSSEINYDVCETSYNEINNESVASEIFDRNTAIELLIKSAQKEFKIQPERRQKRKLPRVADKSKDTEPKIKRTFTSRPGDAIKEVNNIIVQYYATMENKKQHAIQTSDNYEIELPEETPNNDGNYENELPEGTLCNDEMNLYESATTTRQDQIADDKSEDIFENEPDEENNSDQEKGRRRFNKDEYDTKQLFLRLNFDDCLKPDNQKEDTEIINVFQSKEKQLRLGQSLLVETDTNNTDSDNEESYTSDTVPLEHIVNELCQRERNNKAFLCMKNTDQFRPHNYWMLHYSGNFPPVGFEKALERNFSRSFAWLIRLCACIVENTTRALYLQVTNVEKELKKVIKEKKKI